MENRKGVRSAGSKPAVSLRSPQRDTLDQDDLHGKDRDLLSSVQKSPFVSHFSRRSDRDEQRYNSYLYRGLYFPSFGTILFDLSFGVYPCRSISPHDSRETYAAGPKLRNTNRFTMFCLEVLIMKLT